MNTPDQDVETTGCVSHKMWTGGVILVVAVEGEAGFLGVGGDLGSPEQVAPLLEGHACVLAAKGAEGKHCPDVSRPDRLALGLQVGNSRRPIEDVQ